MQGYLLRYLFFTDLCDFFFTYLIEESTVEVCISPSKLTAVNEYAKQSYENKNWAFMCWLCVQIAVRNCIHWDVSYGI
jgi:hypothetical protein